MSLLPFLKAKQISGSIMTTKVRAPDAKPSEDKENSEDNQGLLSGAQDLIKAIQADDHKGVASAFKALFQMLENQPHEENETTPSETQEA